MAYSVTGVTAAPDIGFRSQECHTAQGARDLARRFLTAGLREVEVRDHLGNLQSLRQLDQIAADNGVEELRTEHRLAAL